MRLETTRSACIDLTFDLSVQSVSNCNQGLCIYSTIIILAMKVKNHSNEPVSPLYIKYTHSYRGLASFPSSALTDCNEQTSRASE